MNAKKIIRELLAAQQAFIRAEYELIQYMKLENAQTLRPKEFVRLRNVRNKAADRLGSAYGFAQHFLEHSK